MPIAMSPSPPPNRPRILFLGDDIIHNPLIYERLNAQFDIIQPSLTDLQRPAFIQHLKDRTWGDFEAIMRPSWHTGNEMGKWDRDLIGLLPQGVRVSASAGAGYEWVDVDCMAEHGMSKPNSYLSSQRPKALAFFQTMAADKRYRIGILYCNGGSASTEAVGDMALYHIISVFRHMTSSSLAARSCDPERFFHAHHTLPHIARNPASHTLGIVGLGNIGFVIAKKAHAAFGMKIIYYDIVRKSLEQEKAVDATFYPKVEDMLRKTDCLLLATPFTFSGRPFLTKEIIALLPRGARFVNISRGPLVDEDALAAALESGHIAAAGLDVHASEPNVSERLAGMMNVTMTSHTGGGSVETNDGFERLAMENVERVLRGEEALTGVNGHLIRAAQQARGQTQGSNCVEAPQKEQASNGYNGAQREQEQGQATTNGNDVDGMVA
ncbi:MAG: hypothetical protein Q9225_004768 [Loekoesia sp. 1 TL-2023]